MTHSEFERLPWGLYRARFTGLSPTEHEEYGPGVRWDWTLTEGEHAGREVSAITLGHPTPANKCGRIVAGLSDKPLEVGATIDVSQFIGEEYTLVVPELEPRKLEE